MTEKAKPEQHSGKISMAESSRQQWSHVKGCAW